MIQLTETSRLNVVRFDTYAFVQLLEKINGTNTYQVVEHKMITAGLEDKQ